MQGIDHAGIVARIVDVDRLAGGRAAPDHAGAEGAPITDRHFAFEIAANGLAHEFIRGVVDGGAGDELPAEFFRQRIDDPLKHRLQGQVLQGDAGDTVDRRQLAQRIRPRIFHPGHASPHC